MDLATPPHTLVMPISPDVWARPSTPVRLGEVVFAPKDELHITLIGSRLGRELYQTFAAGFLRDRLRLAMAAQDWRFERTGRLVQLAYPSAADANVLRHGSLRASVVELIDLPAMRFFHQALGALLGRELPVPPPHVTLYTAHDARGIGLASPLQLRVRRLRELQPEVLFHHSR